MKRYALSMALFAFLAHSNEQYSSQHCQMLKEEKQRIQERFAKGYGVAEGNYLNDRDRELFQIMRRHCVRPTDNNQDASTKSPFITSTPSYDRSAINDNWSAHNPTYTGEKALAWDNYYKMPSKCRKIQSSSTEFISCAEDKAQQKKAFEQYWKNRIKLK